MSIMSGLYSPCMHPHPPISTTHGNTVALFCINTPLMVSMIIPGLLKEAQRCLELLTALAATLACKAPACTHSCPSTACIHMPPTQACLLTTAGCSEVHGATDCISSHLGPPKPQSAPTLAQGMPQDGPGLPWARAEHPGECGVG
jgi:hypothetical protein